MECKTGCQQCLELQCNSNCKTCSDNPDFCLSCNNDHYLDSSSNSCIECISPCQTCSYREICDSCIDDYFLISNSCYECNKNCKTTLDDNCKCDTCEDGYYLENYQCFQCDSNCNTCSVSSINCLSCNIGYYLSTSNNCEECPNICEECTNENICNSCINNYFLFNNICYQCNYNCKTSNDNCKCDTCEDGYYLENYQCLSDNSFSGNEQIENMINNIFEDLNINDIDDGNDRKISEKNLMILLTSAENQKINGNKKIIITDLDIYEYKLKQEYNISINDSLYILQIISEEEGMKIPKIEYEVYYNFYNSSNNLTKLNLTLCKGIKIQISIPVSIKINDSIDKYNPKSGYYNDICYKARSKSGTDITLKDRREEFIENNLTLCEENCEFIDYNYTNEKVKCSCEIKTYISPNYDFKFNKNEFIKNFIDIKNIANINIIKCYKIVLKIKNLLHNYGFYIMDSILFLYFLTIFIFLCNLIKN